MSYQTDCTLPDSLLEQIAEQGLGILPELIRIVINTAMQASRSSTWARRPTSGRRRAGVTPTATSPRR